MSSFDASSSQTMPSTAASERSTATFPGIDQCCARFPLSRRSGRGEDRARRPRRSDRGRWVALQIHHDAHAEREQHDDVAANRRLRAVGGTCAELSTKPDWLRRANWAVRNPPVMATGQAICGGDRICRMMNGDRRRRDERQQAGVEEGVGEHGRQAVCRGRALRMLSAALRLAWFARLAGAQPLNAWQLRARRAYSECWRGAGRSLAGCLRS